MPYLTRQKFPVPLDRNQVAQDWRRRGYSCDVCTDPPGMACMIRQCAIRNTDSMSSEQNSRTATLFSRLAATEPGHTSTEK